MVDMSERVEFLRQVDLFSDCSKSELRKIARMAEPLEFKADTQLLEEGASGHRAREAFVIVKGTAIVRRNGRKVAEVGPGQAVGEMALYDDGPRTATVVAGTDVTALVLQARQLKGIVDEMPPVANKMLESLARRLRESNRKLYG